MKLTAALFLVVGTSSALRINQSLSDVAKHQAAVNPELRKKDRQLKQSVERKLADMAVPKRMLQNNNYNYYNYNQNGQNGQDGQDGQNGDGNGQMDWNQYMDDQSIGFDISSYAVKYTQCATVQTYSDDLAENEYADTVLAAKRFALFRLCPKDQCSSRSVNGCGKDYGEYLVSMDQFLLAMMEYQESRVQGYCQYCQQCASIEAAKHFWAAVYNNREYALEQAEQSYQSWYTAYLESYYQNNNNANNGNNQNNANGYQQVDSNIAAQQYYQQVRNSNNYANNYAQNYYDNGNNNNGNNNGYAYSGQAASQYQAWQSHDMWEFQNSQNKYYQNQNTWQSMGSPAGSFYGQTIMNGYYDGDGAFNQVYGYFNANGEYVSLEEEEISWDETLFGEQPDGWDGVTQETESCNYAYAGSCANQYEACMQILQDETYMQYQQYQQNQQNGANAAERASLKDFLGCVEVENDGSNQWAINQYYQENGGSYYYNQYQQQNGQDYDCNGNEYCEQQKEYQENVQQYNQDQFQNRRFYIGPHCGSNSRTISLAVYRDPYCSVIDDSTTVKSLLGYEPNSEALDLFPDECMNCYSDGAAQPWYEDEQQYGLEPMCSMLYQFSGKCNKNLNAVEYANDNAAYEDADGDQYQYQYQYQQYNNANQEGQDGQEGQEEAREQYEYQWKLMYRSMQQQKNEEAVCSFIESLSSNTYNENGEVSVAENAWSSSSWSSSLAQTKAMSPGMMAGLFITAIAAASMAVAACVLHGSLARKNIPWKPRRKQGEDPTDLARQNSGITMGRSRSNVGTNPLL